MNLNQLNRSMKPLRQVDMGSTVAAAKCMGSGISTEQGWHPLGRVLAFHTTRQMVKPQVPALAAIEEAVFQWQALEQGMG